MLTPPRRKPLPPPRFDDAVMADYAAHGYVWTRLSLRGLSARWLTSPGWERASVPSTVPDGLEPIAAFVHPETGAAVGLRYRTTAVDFDPGDFLEVSDPRPATESIEYWLQGSLVAERAGTASGTHMAAAAHRRGPHLVLITAEWPASSAPALTAAITAFQAGLLVDAAPHAPVESYVTATPASLPVLLDHARRFSLHEGPDTVTLRTESRDGPPTEITLATLSPAPGAERALAASAVAFHDRCGKPDPATVRMMVLPSVGHAVAPTAIRTLELHDGREATLAVQPLSPSVGVLIEAVYPGQRQSPAGWLSARFATRRLLASCRLQTRERVAA